MSDGGKGSAPRPFSVSNEEYANRWDAIFRRDIKDDESNVTRVLPQTVKENVEDFISLSKGDKSKSK